MSIRGGFFGGRSTDTTASTPTLTVTAASGSEDTAIALGSHIAAALTDTDGSETLAIKIAGVPTGATLSAGTNNGGGIWTLTPAQLTSLTITPPHNSDAAINLTVTATSTESNGGATAGKSATLAVKVTGVADAPTLAVTDTHGPKNTAIVLGSHITAALTDTDGSEALTIKISGVPTGATLSAGTNAGSGNWTLTPAQLANLTVTPPANSTTPIALTVSAVSTEDNGTTAAIAKTLNVTIDTAADTTASTPTLTVTAAAGNEDTAIALGSHVAAALTDTDGSETLAIKIAGVPTGATLSAGTNNGGGIWTLTPAQLAGLTITPPSNSDAPISLTVTATSTESNGGATASKSATLAVKVTGVADAPTLAVTDTHGLAGTAISLNQHITTALTDTDGSEVLAIKISGVPSGATLSAGTDNGNGSWSLTPAQLAGLTITPPAKATTPFALSVQAISTEDTGATATTTKTLTVTVDPVAQAPSLSASPASGAANTAIPLGIGAQLVHPDPGETLAIKIAGVPTGATLNHGTDQGNGSWSLTPAQLAGLTLTLPAGTSTTPAAAGTVLTVGAGAQYSTLAAAIAASHDGDTIQVQAGTYTNDFATINTKITLVGVGGMVHLLATGNIPNGKAILVTNSDVTISNFEFSGAQVVDGNGAGIRYQAGNLTLNDCYFHDNQEGLLAADNSTGTIAINDSEFAHNGVSNPAAAGYGTTHNLYVGVVAALIITGSYFHDAAVGHEIKSRALATTIQDSRIVDGTTGTASYSIDLPNGGNAIIKNNVIEQGPHSQNPAIISFGEEGSLNPNTSLQVTGNTILNDLASPSALAVHNLTTASAQISGNHFFGLAAGQIAAGPNAQSGNVTLASEPALEASHPWGGSQGPINLTVTATATETDGSAASTSVVLPVTVGVAPIVDTTASTPTLVVAPAAGNEDTAIPLAIAAALTDTDGSESLAILVAGVPAGASLSAGVNNGNGSWSLTPAQLTGLTFTPPGNLDGTFNLTVTATSRESNGGATASTTAPLAVQVAGVADTPTLAVAAAHGLAGTPIPLASSITAALTDTDGSETLAIRIANVPAGAVLSAGTHNADGSWTVTPAQLGGLTITPPTGAAGFALAVTAVSTEDNGTTASTAAKALNVAIDTPPPPPPPPSGNIVDFQLQNNQATALAAHEITFGQVFAPGQVPQGGHLVAVINGVQVPVQLDVKTTNADGSVKMGIITLDAPAIPANTTLSAMLALTTATPGPSVDIAKLPTSGYSTTVDLTVHNADGTNTAYHLDAGALLAAALKAGTVSYWMQGPQATEVRVDAPIAGSLHVTFDITSFADGTSRTDVQFNNDYAMQPVGGEVKYDATIRQGGNIVLQQANIDQFQYQTWHQEVWSNGAPQVNIQHDIAGLEKLGVVQNYDLSIPVDPALIAQEAAAMTAAGWGGVLAANGVTKYMPTTGGRGDIGPTTQANTIWLMTQDQTAAQYALGQADAAGSVPWHFFDPTTGLYTWLSQYPRLWTDPRGGNGPPTGLTQQVDPGAASGWTPDAAHQPDLAYDAYLLTGNRYYLDQLNAQATFDILYDYPAYRQDGLGLVVNGLDQVRQQAWSLRQIDEAAWANPDGSAEKAYFTQISANNWHWLVSQLPAWTAQEGAAYGYIPGAYGGPSLAPWEQDYFASTVIAAAEQGNQDAIQVLKWEANFLVGRFMNAANGFDPHDGVAYNLSVYAGPGTSYQSWAEIEHATQAAGQSNNGGWSQSDGDYAQLALMSLAGIITVTGSTDAMQAYNWLLTSGAPYINADPTFNIAPRLPDGVLLQNSQMQIDTSTKDVTLTAHGGDSLLHAGGGNDTLVGGSGTVDLLFGGTGTTTLKAGTGNDYLFGGTGKNTFIDNIGNNFMKGGPSTNAYVFNEAHSGHDTIANFNPATDQLQITHGLNGNGVATVADLIAGATVSNGNTILHLSAHDDITLLGIASPAALSHAIVIL